MAESALFYPAREKFATALLNWVTGVVRAAFIADGYNVDLEAEFLADIPEAQRVSVSMPLTGRTATRGICAANAIRFPLLFDSRLISHAVLYKDTEVPATSELIAYIGKEGLLTAPFVPVGLDYFIYPNVVDKGYFRL